MIEHRGVVGGIWHVLRVAGPERPQLAAGAVFVVVAGAAGLVYPQAIRHLVDGALGPAGVAPSGWGRLGLGAAAGAMAALALVQGLAGALAHYHFELAGERVVARLRTRLFGALMDQEMAYFDEAKTGELMSRLSADTEVLHGAIARNLSSLLAESATVVGGVGMLLYSSPSLTALMVLIIPPALGGATVLGRRLERLATRAQDSLAVASGIAEESIAGVRTVRAFAAEPRVAARYARSIGEALVHARLRIRANALFLFAAVATAYIGVAAMFWYGSSLVQIGVLTMGQLTSFLVYTLFVAVALGTIGSTFAELSRVRGAADRVFEMMDRRPRMASGRRVLAEGTGGRLVLDRVDFSYPSRPDAPVLAGVEIVLGQDQTTALVGASGAGKTSLALLVARFYDPVRGAILLDGHDLRDLDVNWFRDRIGIVSQEPTLFSGTIGDNIRFARPDASDDEVSAAARAANAEAFIQALPSGFATQVGERGVRLSGGQRQRIAIARAVLKDPRILILDEATSALDAESEYLVQEALSRLMRGRTSIVIAHRLSTVMHAEQVVVLEAGRVAQIGTHAALMQVDGVYRRLVERQLSQS